MSVNELKAGATLNYIILGLNALLGLVYTPFMLRMLGQSEYGIYSLAASVIAYLSILDLGFGNAVIRYTAKFRAEGKLEEQYSLFGMFTLFYAIIGLLVLCIGLVLYFNVGNLFGKTLSIAEIQQTKTIILLMVFNLAITFPLSIYGAIITAYENFIFLRILQIFRLLLTTIVMICLLKLGYKAVALVIAQTFFNVITLWCNYFYCRRKIKIKVRFSRLNIPLLKEIMIYSFWIFLNVLFDRIYWSTGQFVLGATIGSVAIAVFAVAIQLEGMYMMFSTGVSGVFLPRITAMVTFNNSWREISDLFTRVGRIQFIVIAYILSGFIVFGKAFIYFWAGKDYGESYIITLIFFVSLTIPLIQNLGIIILQARNQMKFRSLLYLVISLVSLFWQIPMARYFGGIGCALAIGGALLLGHGLIINIYYSRVQQIDIGCFWKAIAKMSVVPVIMVVISLFVMKYFVIDSVWKLIMGIIVYSMVYFPLFWNFSMNEYEHNLLKTPLLKLVNRAR